MSINKRQAELIFTLHFATINTSLFNIDELRRRNLHYTLLLLILLVYKFLYSSGLYLHYTLLLLIPADTPIKFNTFCPFTLHFATINTIEV